MCRIIQDPFAEFNKADHGSSIKMTTFIENSWEVPEDLPVSKDKLRLGLLRCMMRYYRPHVTIHSQPEPLFDELLYALLMAATLSYLAETQVCVGH